MMKFISILTACLWFLVSSCKEDAILEVRGVEFGTCKAEYSNAGIQFSAEIEKTNGTITEKGFVVTRNFNVEWWDDKPRQDERTYVIAPNDPFELILESDFDEGKDCTALPYVKMGDYTYTADLLTIQSPKGASPVITSYSPTHGPVGTVITIQGKYFSPIASRNNVFSENEKASVHLLESSETEMKVVFDYYFDYTGKQEYLTIGVMTGSLRSSNRAKFEIAGWSVVSISPDRVVLGETLTIQLANAEGLQIYRPILYQGNTYIAEIYNYTFNNNLLTVKLPDYIDFESGANYHIQCWVSGNNAPTGYLTTPTFKFKEQWEQVATTEKSNWYSPIEYNGDTYFRDSENRTFIRYSPTSGQQKKYSYMALSEQDKMNIGHVTFAYQGAIYSSNDYSSYENYQATLYKMDLSSGTWSRLNNVPFRVGYLNSQATTNDGIYVLNWEFSFEAHGDVSVLYKYLPTTDQWVKLSVLPSNAQMIFARNQQLWTISGGTVYSINRTDYSCTKAYSISEQSSIFSAFVVGDYIYFRDYGLYYRYNILTQQTEPLYKPADRIETDYGAFSYFHLDGNIYICNNGKLYRYIGNK